MRIDFDTTDLTEADALSLAVLIHAQYPNVLSTLSMMTAGAALMSRASEAGLSQIGDPDSLDAERAFGGPGAPVAVAPSAEEAFAGPPAGAVVPVVETEPGISTADGGSALSSNTSTVSGPELDADGLPHDTRIHSSNRKKTADGRWWAKKGVSNDTKTTVTVELKALMATPLVSTTAAVAPPSPGAVVPTSSTVSSTAAAVTPPAAVIAPAVPAAPVAAAPIVPPAPAPTTTTGAPAASPATTQVFPPEVARAAEAAVLAEASDVRPPGLIFTEVMRKVTDAQMAGKLSPEELGAVCAAVSIGSPRELLAQPSLAPTFLATLDAFVQSKG